MDDSLSANPEIEKSLKFHFAANLLDGGFFGFALGFASFVTILPLFVSTMTSSALLIGLVLQYLASLKLHSPGLMAHCPAFSAGRLLPAATNA